ncbi:MAG: adenylate/guanylate cyclase domain-containing protein [Candidatus Dormibacteria bacterium]
MEWEADIERDIGDLEAAARAGRRLLDLAKEGDVFHLRARRELVMTLAELDLVEEATPLVVEPDVSRERLDLLLDCEQWARYHLAVGANDEVVWVVRQLAETGSVYGPMDLFWIVAVDSLVAAGAADEAAELWHRLNATGGDTLHPTLSARIAGTVALGKQSFSEAAALLGEAADGFRAIEWRREEARTRLVRAPALAEVAPDDLRSDLEAGLAAARACNGHMLERLIRQEMEARGWDAGLATSPLSGRPAPVAGPTTEQLITLLFADVRGFTSMTQDSPQTELHDRITAYHRRCRREVERRHGVVKLIAGDGIMAVFNLDRPRADHCRHVLEAALAIQDQAEVIGLPVGIGLAVGAAVVNPVGEDQGLSILGHVANLASRLQAEAAAGDVLIDAEAHRRVDTWLRQKGLSATREDLDLKGIRGAVEAYRVRARTPRAARG